MPPGALLDVFISYARSNRPVAQELADALEAQQLRVWWDSDLSAGSEFAEVIEDRLRDARVVLVLWSADSVRSAFVRDESSRALRSNKLMPLRIEDVELPLGFGQLHTLDLLDWHGDADSPAFQKVVSEIRLRGTNQATDGPAIPRAGGRATTRPRWAVAGTVVVLLLALGIGGRKYWDVQKADAQQRELAAQAESARKLDAARAEADRHFRLGLDQQYANVPQLEAALNEYLSALESRPGHGRARYYLGHVYAQTGKTVDALDAFRQALNQTEAPLDRSQRADAEKQIVSLSRVSDEATPIARAATADSAASAPPPSGATSRPADKVTPVAEPAANPRPPSPSVAVTAAAGTTAMAAATFKTPQRIEPVASRVATLMPLIDAMFDNDKDNRITATTTLVVDPESLSDALPLAIAKALGVLAGPKPLSPAASSGVVNTLVLLQSALPGSFQMQREGVEALIEAAQPLGDYTRQQAAKVSALLAQAPARRPVAYLQIANEAQRPIALALAERFRVFGYDAPGIELVGERAPQRTELRVQGKSDRFYARWINRTLTELAGSQPVIRTLRNARPKTDTFEIWLPASLCAPGGRMVVNCGPG
ncbi:hypothetical protein BH11PSE8_BH11PSE8_20160 [soil metagenome]